MDLFRLDGEVALVTGAGSGIGQASRSGSPRRERTSPASTMPRRAGWQETAERIDAARPQGAGR